MDLQGWRPRVCRLGNRQERYVYGDMGPLRELKRLTLRRRFLDHWQARFGKVYPHEVPR